MRYSPLSASFHTQNRKEIYQQIHHNAIIILHSNDLMPRNGDQHFPFRQNADLLYLCGIDQEDTILLLYPDHPDAEYKEIIFTRQTNERIKIWDGPKLSKEQVSIISGINNCHWAEEFEEILEHLIPQADYIYLPIYKDPKKHEHIIGKNARFYHDFEKRFPGKAVMEASPIIHETRIIKKQEEIDHIRQACNITAKAFERLCKFVRPNVHEYEIEAEITHEFIRNRAQHAFHPVIASGKNACILHYIHNESQCKDGELLLMDFGAEYGNYASDLSRTIPVNGKFSPRQKECYRAVLDVFKKAKKLMVPGNTIENINQQTIRWMEEKMVTLGLFTQSELQNTESEKPLYMNYFMHGTSHFMGLDVHDVGTRQVRLEKGMIITCEPGLYIKEKGIGIRIESDILVENEPIDLMEEVPIEIEDIEKAMEA